MFRHALLLAGGADATSGGCETMLRVSVEACERYFQAFQFVLGPAYRRAKRSISRCSRQKAKPESSAFCPVRARPGSDLECGRILPHPSSSGCHVLNRPRLSVLPYPRRRRKDGGRHAGRGGSPTELPPLGSRFSTPARRIMVRLCEAKGISLNRRDHSRRRSWFSPSSRNCSMRQPPGPTSAFGRKPW